ncbi:MAG: hypothetical protein HKP55_04180 [Gammaproteobacteria bacterium]|nr:hypothetical protein [Gammaproteobacteria bacterium]
MSQTISSNEQAEAIINLSAKARKWIYIFSHELEPAFYDQPEFIVNCKAMVLRHPQCHIKILVQQNENLKKMDHRFLDLMHRLASRIELKLCHEDYRTHPETFMLVDDQGIFLKRTPGRTSATVDDNNRRLNNEYQRLFNAVWDQSDYDISLRQLSI